MTINKTANTQPSIKRLFVDLETSPNVVLSWRIGYKINISHDNILKERKIICIGYKWEHEDKVHVISWDKNQDERAMLKKFSKVANEADELIGHNSDSFDFPWLRTRMLVLGFDPIPQWKTCDTLQWARKYYYFNSNKLDYLGEILGFGKKIKTEFDLWKAVVLDNDRGALARMMRYCARDIDLLVKVFTKLKPCTKPKSHVGVMNGQPRWSCPETGSLNVRRKKKVVTPMGIIQHQMFCRDSKLYFKVSDLVYRQYLEYLKDKKDEREGTLRQRANRNLRGKNNVLPSPKIPRNRR